MANRESDDATAVLSAAEVARLSGDDETRYHVLVHLDGKDIGKVVRLEQRDYLIGRRQECDLTLNYEGVSRQHARISYNGGNYLIQDLNSRNGTAIGGRRIQRHELSDGDVIQFGPLVRVRYSITDSNEENMLRHLYEASVRDPLTGAYNREYLDERLRSEIAYADRHNTETSLIMCDLDHFKYINDTYGHQAGDAVLIAVVQSVTRDLRKEDVFARYGGEEFAISLRGINLEGARQLAERIRIRNHAEIPFENHRIPISMSMGCASLACCASHTVETLIATADRRLYAAKQGGRNRVVAAG